MVCKPDQVLEWFIHTCAEASERRGSKFSL